MNTRAPAILDHLASLADTTRSRILLLLDGHELTVSELCGIMQLPQSTVSRHLKALGDTAWVAARAEGTGHLYSRTRDDLDASTRRLWVLVREQIGPTPAAAQDQRRLAAALAERRTTSQEFFSSSAGQWDRVRDELFGDRFHLAALAAFADGNWTVGDLGCGTGQVTAAIAPFVARVIAVDASAAMLQARKPRRTEDVVVFFRLCCGVCVRVRVSWRGSEETRRRGPLRFTNPGVAFRGATRKPRKSLGFSSFFGDLGENRGRR